MQKLNVLILGVLIAALSSCVSQKKIAKICQTCPVRDSISYKETIKLKDTIIYISTAGPIQYLENPCKHLCDSLGNFNPFSITEHENGLTSTIKSVGNSIAFNCDADSLRAVIKGLQEHNRTSSSVVTLPPRYMALPETLFQRICRWWFWISIAAGSLYAIFRLIKAKFSF